MASKPNPADSSQAGTFGGEAADTVRQAKDAAFDAARSATKTVDAARPAVAERLDTAASTIEEGAQRIPGGQKVKDLAQAAADTLGSTADYMRSHDTRRMVSDVEHMVRNNPGPALLIAGIVGFMLGRAAIRR